MSAIASEAKRGCGMRHVGGLYLMAGSLNMACGRLPYPLTVCPTCGAGIKPARGWTWLDWEKYAGKCPEIALFAVSAHRCHMFDCAVCLPRPGQYGLIWVGEKHYKTPGAFTEEAAAQGISRRISAIPKGFKVGETWVLLAHRYAMPEQPILEEGLDPEEGKPNRAAIFSCFKPDRIETLVRESDATPEHIESLEKRGITPVVVVDDWEQRHHGKKKTEALPFNQ